MKDMGKTNAKWGDCGFTSSFYAMWKLDPGSRAALQGMPQAFTVIEEIRKYLERLKSEGSFSNLLRIEAFCQSFGGPWAKFTVADYLIRAANAGGKDEATLLGEDFSIGMPPISVKDYLSRVWKFESTVIDCSVVADDGADGIVGLCLPPGTVDHLGNVVNTHYNRLVHFMYRRKSKYYSWGHDTYTDLAVAAKGGGLGFASGWYVGWLIKIGGKVV